MSDQIPTNLKTGFSNVKEADDLILNETAQQIISLVAVMMRQAIKVALTYAMHDDREMATENDIIDALKYQARHFLQTIDQPDVMQETVDMYSTLFDDAEDDIMDLDEQEIVDEIDDDEILKEELGDIKATANVSNGTCMCTVCTDIRESVSKWDSWHPEDEAEQFLKSSVERAIVSFENDLE